MTPVRSICFGALLLALAACSTGLWSNQGAQVFPPIAQGKGRVFVYRSSAMVSTYIPEVLLNGERLGRLDRRGVVFKDVAPGSYAVTTAMTPRVVNFALSAGEKKYVNFTGSFFDSHLHPELVEAAKGEAEVASLELLVDGRK